MTTLIQLLKSYWPELLGLLLIVALIVLFVWLRRRQTALETLPDVIDTGAWATWTEAVKARTGAKGKALFMPLRLMLTGQAHGPDMAAMVRLLGRETLVRRLNGEAS